MKFSIIMPAHNAAEFIDKALQSVVSQTYKDYELIVVCDACEDNTAEIARSYGATVYEVDYKNEGPTRNFGLDHATGEWVLWIDDDDWWLHEFVLEQLAGKLGDEDMLRFSFIWKDRCYARCDDYIAVWNKCWRRSFIGDTRFKDAFPVDEPFHHEMMSKNPKIKDWDMPMYYYNYLHEGSQWWKILNS